MSASSRQELTPALPNDDELDPELVAVVRSLRERALQRPPLGSVSVEHMRARATAEFAEWNRDPEPIAAVRDFNVPAARHAIAVRLYEPKGNPRDDADTGLLVYAHGGGWIIGDLQLEDAALRYLAVRSGVRIVSVDYRLLPEHPFPAGIDDVATVLQWLAADAGPRVAAGHIALGGASAGANVALGTALKLRDEHAVMPCFLLLMYGAYAGGADTASSREFADGRFGLPAVAMNFFWRTYLGSEGAPHPWQVPLHADLRGLPAAFVTHAGLDVLRDDSIALTERLRSSGVSVEARAYPGAIHGYTQFLKRCALARGALDEAAQALAIAVAADA